MRDYSKDFDGLAYWMIPAVVAWDIAIFWLQQAIIAHSQIHQWSDE